MSALHYSSPQYRLDVAPNGLSATLSAPDGRHLLTLRPLAALDTTDGADETLSVEVRDEGGGRFVVERRSTRWERAAVTLVCTAEAVEVHTSVAGRGDLTDVRLLAGRSLVAGQLGFLPSGSSFPTLFSPSPAEPDRPVRSAAEPAAIGVTGDSEPGRRHWFFTPAPLYLAFSSEEVGEWLTLSVAAPIKELGFVQLSYEPSEGGFALRLDYDGHTRVDGEFRAPTLVLVPGVADPYEGLRRHRDDLVRRGAAPAPAPRDPPAWWREPIFCGWGAQCHLASANGRAAADFATQASYDAFLDHLEREGIRPGTIVLDDKWQAAYGTNEPDPAKWPDLAAWIAGRHTQDQRVLLWWKAWDPEGLPPELCVRNSDGVAVALDPSNPDARELLRRAVTQMLGAGGLDADGLKIDFTARTPSGRALSHHGPAWGIALLHELLATVYGAAKAAKPDALVVTHTPHPAFADVTDMIRLNDMSAYTPVPEQMRYRADVVRAACPELLIDTDDWPAPSLAVWREYLALKPRLGVPALYYAGALDATGERFEAQDYDALRQSWVDWRSGR